MSYPRPVSEPILSTARETLLSGAELSPVDKREGGHQEGSSPSRVSRGGLDGAGVLKEYYRGCSPPCTHSWHPGQLRFAEPVSVPFTDFRSRMQLVPDPGPERRACSLHEAPSC